MLVLTFVARVSSSGIRHPRGFKISFQFGVCGHHVADRIE